MAPWWHRTVQDPRSWAVALFLLLPTLLLGPCLFGERTFVPYDVAAFPPQSYDLEPQELERLTDGMNRDVTEIPVWFVPQLRQAGEALARGEMPAWSPWARGGSVLLAHGLDGILYPPVWVAMAHQDPAQGLVWVAWIHFAAAGLLAFGLLRRLGIGVQPALLGGVVFAFSGTLTANAHFYMRLGSLVWLPGVLWGALACAANTGWRRVPGAVGLATALALTWLAGFAPFSAVCTLVAAAFCLVLVLRSARSAGPGVALRSAGWLLLAGILGMALAAPHILPMLLFFPVSARATAPGLEHLSHTAFSPGGLIGYLLPDALGHPSAAHLLPYDRSPLAWLLIRRVEWGSARLLPPNYNYTEFALFLGTLPLVLAVLGIARRRGNLRWFAAAAMALLILMALGAGPLKYLFGLPLLHSIPPLRFLGPACLFGAWLAALGAERLLSGGVRGTWLCSVLICVLISSACALLAGSFQAPAPGAPDPFTAWSLPEALAARYSALDPDLTPQAVRPFFTGPQGADYWEQGRAQWHAALRGGALALCLAALALAVIPWLRARAATLAALILIALPAGELLVHGRAVNRGIARIGGSEPAIQRELAALRAATDGGFTVARAHKDARAPLFLAPGTLAKDRIRDLNVYTYVDGWSNRPLVALYPDENLILGGSTPKTLPDDPRLGHPYFDLIGLRYLISPVPLAHAGGPGQPFPGRHGTLHLYERPGALPRAFVVPAARTLADQDAVVAALTAKDLDPWSAALVTADQLKHLQPPVEPAPVAAYRTRRPRFTVDDPAEVVLELPPGPAGILVLADTLLPGWSAAVDGVEVPIARANQWMRAVSVPATGCAVRFTYHTPGLAAGTWIWALALAALAALGRVWWVSRRGTRRTDIAL